MTTSRLLRSRGSVRSRRRSEAFEGLRRSSVARSIAADHGFTGGFVDVDETTQVFDVINQTGQTDARFLRKLAEREGFEFYVDDNGLHFHARRKSAPPTHVFTWFSDPGRGDVLSVSVESDLGRRVGKVTVKGRDPLSKNTLEHSVNNDTAQRETLAEVIEVVDPETGETSLETRNATSSVVASAAGSWGQIKEEAQARYRGAEQMSVKLAMQVVGDPTLHAKSIIEVRGVSSLLSGKYYVTDVKHVISSSGYISDLKLTRDGSGRMARKLAQEMQGERNQSEAVASGELKEIEVVNPESGETHIEYRGGEPLGATFGGLGDVAL